jgi:hypothetical protein
MSEPLTVVVCTNRECAEYGIEKHTLPGTTFPPGMVIMCGECGQPCSPPGPAPEPV